eukprot:CAMPEP_0119115218 /NCGR_PEP_ID=MMETSP1180-20130426/50193_1 /TAXON_ID=3052 ORGANISM="Chlamydomonas cf sp, Strain CCMP681" /NCGR_SAMPLE_ID=MMETSP1180 /ASSEMBLY_ACC=CAM_ASM_000741 /LENGTH=48 /DNA_ID= /DNA_START= /DNA_END= /DNA_ORIENTATION=
MAALCAGGDHPYVCKQRCAAGWHQHFNIVGPLGQRDEVLRPANYSPDV